MDLGYASHLERLREALWCDRQTGRASVLVGAGFSRNARQRAPTTRPFPLWRDLGSAMVRDLNVDVQAISNPLRLASQYEAAFGRPALDELLLRLVPNDQYEPGEAHRLLLLLPWADIFTTNYDTLLERTRPLVHTRRYDVVLAPEDLPHSARPRIVKLHGSIPSHRPFVSTEEDFRRYPRDSSPFVNTLQQSAMETTLCLLGFGGDDPNFLQWAGWVRDNLGEHAPAILLIGLLDLPESERVLLASRRVTPVDLGPLFPKNQWHDPQVRHEKAMLWLLRSLHQGRPSDTLRWPSVLPVLRWPDETGSPSLLPPSSASSSPPHRPPPEVSEVVVSQETALELVSYWKAQRQAYPGWLVCPESNRQVLQECLVPSTWSFDEVLAALLELPPASRLLSLSELVWRLRTGLSPISDNCITIVAETLERVNPWPGKLDDIAGPLVVTPLPPTTPALDWQDLENAWTYLAFALLRDARHCYDETRLERWRQRLDKICTLKVDWQHWAKYEHCQHLLSLLKYSELREALNNWSTLPTPRSPLWLGRRAALHAEAHELDAARQLTANALETARAAQSPTVSNIALLSLEGWFVGLQSILANASWMNTKEKSDDPVCDPRERLLVLGGLYRCDPHVDLEARRSELLRPIPPAHEMKPGFDPGIVHSNHHVRASGDDAPWALALMPEEGCWPLRAGVRNVPGKQISIAALRLAPLLPEYSLSLLIRSHSDGLDEWLTREHVGILEDKTVTSMFGLLDGAIQDALLDSRQLPAEMPRCLEALSRLCFRLSSSQHQHVLDLAAQLFASPEASSDREVVKKVDVLFKRLLFSMAKPDLALAIPKLLSLPLRGPQRRMGFDYPDPFRHVDRTGLRLSPTQRQIEWESPIAELLRSAKDGNPATRLNAWDRLSVLFETGALTDSEAATMGHALWHRVDARGLPADVPFTMPYLLRLPEPTPGFAQKCVRAALLARPFPSIHRGSSGISSAVVAEATDFMASLFNCTSRPWYRPDLGRTRIEWSHDEVRSLLDAARAWWTEAKPTLEGLLKRGGNDDFARLARNAIRMFVLVLGDVFAIRLPGSASEEHQLLSRLIDESCTIERTADFRIPHARVRLGSNQDEVRRETKARLLTFKDEEATATANGIVAWQLWSQAEAVAAPGSELVDEFILYSVLHRDASVSAWLSAVTDLVRFAPGAITDRHLEALALGLARLLEDTRLDAPGDGAASLPLHERPKARSEAARLAWALWGWCSECQTSDPPHVLSAWRDACSVDPLPEVRRAWGQ